MKRKVRIGDAKKIAQEIGADGVAVFVFVDGVIMGASYGETKDKCFRLGKWLDHIVDGVCGKTLPDPGITR